MTNRSRRNFLHGGTLDGVSRSLGFGRGGNQVPEKLSRRTIRRGKTTGEQRAWYFSPIALGGCARRPRGRKKFPTPPPCLAPRPRPLTPTARPAPATGCWPLPRHWPSSL